MLVGLAAVALVAAVLFVSLDRRGSGDAQPADVPERALADLVFGRGPTDIRADIGAAGLETWLHPERRPPTCAEERHRAEADRVLEYYELAIIKRLCGGFGDPTPRLDPLRLSVMK